MAVTAAVAVAVATAGWFYLASRRGPHITMPDTIIGLPKIDTPAAQIVVAGIQDRGKKLGVKAQAGIYGSSQTQPSIVVLTVLNRTSVSADELMSEFTASAVDPNNTYRLNLLALSRSTHDGATFICAPFLAQANRTMCVWKDDGVIGFVGESDLAVDPMTLTSIVRTVVET